MITPRHLSPHLDERLLFGALFFSKTVVQNIRVIWMRYHALRTPLHPALPFVRASIFLHTSRTMQWRSAAQWFQDP